MNDSRKVSTLETNCYEIELTEGDREAFGLDVPAVLLELRPYSGLYGIFYTAKGMQWDLWSDLAEEAERREIGYAVRDPAKAACELLGHRWRPDFEYEPDDA